MTDGESFNKGMWWELTGLRGKTTHNPHQPSRKKHKPFIPDPYYPMNISSNCNAFARREHFPVPFDYTVSPCMVPGNCIVCFRDIAFIFQMPPSLMSVSRSPTSEKCLRDVHLPCTLHPSLQVPYLFLSKEWFSNIFFLAPCVYCEMISPLVGLCPVNLHVSFVSALWGITSSVKLFHHFDDHLTNAWKDNLLFPQLQIVEGGEIRIFLLSGTLPNYNDTSALSSSNFIF